MPWNVKVAINRSPEADVAGYRWYMDGAQVGSTPQTAAGTDPEFTYQFPEADRTPLLEVSAVDNVSPAPNVSAKVGVSQHFDAQAPAAPANFRVLAAVFVA